MKWSELTSLPWTTYGGRVDSTVDAFGSAILSVLEHPVEGASEQKAQKAGRDLHVGGWRVFHGVDVSC